MTKKDREELIDKLLVELNDSLEKKSIPGRHADFNFEKNSENTVYLTECYGINYEDLQQIVNVCISRGLLKNRYMDKYSGLFLTEEGQGRAISVGSAEFAKPIIGSTISIGTLNANGSTQIGDNNNQNVEYVFNSIIEKIDNSESSEEEKSEAKNLLGRFIAHPLTNSIIGAASTVITAKLGGA